MDVQMPGLDGLEATRRIASSSEGPAVLVLTTFDRDDYLFQALEAGASGFLLKTASPEQLVDAVRVLAAGEALLSPAVTRRVIERFGAPTPNAPAPAPAPDEALAQLTEREAEVFRLLADGLSNVEIARRLYVGEATVKTHVSNILLKLGVRDRVQAVVRAYRSGFVRA
jgi:DNA-binding NarL/FixJ family response regulator